MEYASPHPPSLRQPAPRHLARLLRPGVLSPSPALGAVAGPESTATRIGGRAPPCAAPPRGYPQGATAQLTAGMRRCVAGSGGAGPASWEAIRTGTSTPAYG